MKANRNLTPFLPLGLLLTSGPYLIDRFITPLPDWLVLTILCFAIASLMIHAISYRRTRAKELESKN